MGEAKNIYFTCLKQLCLSNELPKKRISYENHVENNMTANVIIINRHLELIDT